MLTGKFTGSRPLGKPKRRWETNIIMDLKEIGIDTRNWVDSVRDKGYWRVFVNPAFKRRVPYAVELF